MMIFHSLLIQLSHELHCIYIFYDESIVCISSAVIFISLKKNIIILFICSSFFFFFNKKPFLLNELQKTQCPLNHITSSSCYQINKGLVTFSLYNEMIKGSVMKANTIFFTRVQMQRVIYSLIFVARIKNKMKSIETQSSL